MQAYHFPLCVSIFNFSLNPLVASQHPPLQREANPHKSLLTALRHCEEQGDEAIHKPQKVNTKNKKEKEFTVFYQVKKLIFNVILIFNFQFSISYRLPRVASNSRNDEFCLTVPVSHTEIATGFSSPRNDGVGVLSLRRPKACSNPQITSSSSFYKKKNSPSFAPFIIGNDKTLFSLLPFVRGSDEILFSPPPFVKAKATKSQGVEKI